MSCVRFNRRWKILAAECVFTLILCVVAVFIAKPAFLVPLEEKPTRPVQLNALLRSLPKDTIVGSAPKYAPFAKIMGRAAELLGTEIIMADQENQLNELLYNRVHGTPGMKKVIWILWANKTEHVYRYTMKSTEVGSLFISEKVQADGALKDKVRFNPHLQSGFVGVECAVNHALLEHTANDSARVKYDLSLIAMPVSPLMEADKVARAVSLILMCYTLALLPPVLETEALVVRETNDRFKRALRVRSVDYSTMYLGWLTFALLTATPICLIGSTALIVIFRWIHLMYALITLMSYFTIMMVMAFIMCMFHTSPLISTIWTVSQTLLQTFLAELIVHHRNLDETTGVMTFLIKALLPPLGLLNGFNQFALLITGRELSAVDSMGYTIMSWSLLLLLYFMLLMLLQRTIGSARAIGGQVSWKSIIFKRATDRNELRPVKNYSPIRKGRLQEVDEFIAKAACFSDVSKSIMGVPYLKNVTFSVYRGEFSSIFSERIQIRTAICVEDLLTGLTYADSGTINVLGVELNPSRNLLTEHMMTGYCDRSSILIDDLTVEEHLHFYTEVCLWHELYDTVFEFSVIRHNILKKECDLADVYLNRVGDLSSYYRAQLCWAIAVLLEPKMVIIPQFHEHPIFNAVLKDKIMTNRTFLTIVNLTLSSMDLQYADRLFLLDNRVLAFGGTPAYMFYLLGRDYRIRMSFNSGSTDPALMEELVSELQSHGATVRAQLGSLLIMRMPTEPSANVAKLTEYIEKNMQYFDVKSLFVSLPDPEEVFRRAIHESRQSLAIHEGESTAALLALEELQNIPEWKRKTTGCTRFLHLRNVAWKYFTCYIHYRFFLIITFLSAISAGFYIGYDLGRTLRTLEFDKYSLLKQNNTLTVESTNRKTTLVIRVDMSDMALDVASAYVLSHTNSSDAEVDNMSYISLVYPESLTEYLATRAVDSPQLYVYMYAYGMDIQSVGGGRLQVQALYSPLHKDRASAPRSIARVYMALMRYYSGHLDASVEVVDSPLILSYTLLAEQHQPLFVQFLLVLSISHITLVPSKEYGLIRHMQKNAMNFSPFRYWLNLAICDVILYWILVLVITVVAFVVLFFYGLRSYLHFASLLAIPLMLMVYGVGCIPQAYLFSLGPSAPLNSMALIITNIVFGEATLVAKLFYGDAYNYALSFMALSPQFNMAFAIVKISQIFIYNIECSIFEKKHLCSNKMLHKCCDKCGVLEDCFKRKSFMSAIQNEVLATLGTAVMMFTVLMLWEYRTIPVVWNATRKKILHRKPDEMQMMPGVMRERDLAIQKEREIKRHDKKQNPYGENLLIVDASRVENDHYLMRHVYFGLAKGEALALAGMKHHGRLMLCEMIAGLKTKNDGHLWAVSKYRQRCSPHQYAKHVVLCSDRSPLPPWMTVYDGLEMLAILRGVPLKHVRSELENYISALCLNKQEDLQICHLLPTEKYRLHFAAAVIGAPPILVFNDCTAYQSLAVKRSMYSIISLLRKRGHSIVYSGFSVESHMPVTTKLAIVRDGRLFDLDHMNILQERYGGTGYTVVVHLKDEVDVDRMFRKYFRSFNINDTSDVLVNVQVTEKNLTWSDIFNTMEKLKEENSMVYSYIICTKPIDYIYQNIIADEGGLKRAGDYLSMSYIKNIFGMEKRVIEPPIHKLRLLKGYARKYSLTKLEDLPWSVIFRR